MKDKDLEMAAPGDEFKFAIGDNPLLSSRTEFVLQSKFNEALLVAFAIKEEFILQKKNEKIGQIQL